MRLILATFLAFAIIIPSSYSRTPEDWRVGSWEGAVEREGSIQIVQFDISKTDSVWQATYNIPEMMIYEQPVTGISVADSAMLIHFLYGTFDMHCFADIEQMTGTNPGWKPAVRLHLKKLGDPINYWFARREVKFTGGGGEITGTLLVPSGTGPFPAVVITHGGGDSTRGEWEYRTAAYGLTRQGIAAFIYDQRGHGESTGNPDATLWDHADDALAAVAAVRKQPNIDPTKVGMYGPSRGGWVCEIAAARTDHPDFVVLMHGPALSVRQQDFDGLERTMASQDFTQPQIDSAVQQAKLYFDLVDRKIDFSKYAQQSLPKDNIGWGDYGHFAESANDPDVNWWRVNVYDPADDLSRVKCPVMAVFAEKDTYVAPASNLDLMTKLVKSSGQPFSTVTIPNLPHAVATWQTLRGGEWNWPTGFWVWSYRPVQMDKSVAEWVKGR